MISFLHHAVAIAKCHAVQLTAVQSASTKIVKNSFFLKKMLGTWYGPVGPDLSDFRGPLFSDSRDPIIIFSDSRDPIWNSMDPNHVPKTP